MRRKRFDHELRRVVKRVLRLVPTDHAVGKAEFELIHARILACVQEKTNTSVETLGQLTAKVLGDLPQEYGRLDEQGRSWPALIAYLYCKYLSELDLPDTAKRLHNKAQGRGAHPGEIRSPKINPEGVA